MKNYKVKKIDTIFPQKIKRCVKCGWWSCRVNKREKHGVIRWAGVKKCVACGLQPYSAASSL